MNKLILPNGLKVSNVALGAMDFGMGGNFADTSSNYAHTDDPTTPPPEETMEAFHRLVEKRKVRRQ